MDKIIVKMESTLFLSTLHLVNIAWLAFTIIKSMKLNNKQHAAITEPTVINGINNLSIGWS